MRYYPHTEGYWRSSRAAGGELLHRAVWAAAHGSIPADWHIHHRDGDPGNNALANLVALAPGAHRAEHPGQRHTPETRERIAQIKREWWAERKPRTLVCETCAQEFQTTGTRVRFCSPRCNATYWNARRPVAKVR